MERNERPNGLIDALDRAGRRLGFESTMRNQAAARLVGLHSTDWLALDLLDSTGPVPIGTLADRLGLSRPAATALVDRLETAGLVNRRSAEDRRLVVVAPLDDRGAAYDDIDHELRAEMAELCSTFDDAELRVVLRFVHGAADVLARITAQSQLATIEPMTGRVSSQRSKRTR